VLIPQSQFMPRADILPSFFSISICMLYPLSDFDHYITREKVYHTVYIKYT
jgi:hypothetical protein